MTNRRTVLRRTAATAVTPLLPFTPATAADSTEQVAQLLRQGRCVVAFRHALAPGTFDPPQFKAGDCSTQRNLSDEGRDQARRIGAWFRQQALVPAAVRSSPWCPQPCAAAPGAAAWTPRRWPLAAPRLGRRWVHRVVQQKAPTAKACRRCAWRCNAPARGQGVLRPGSATCLCCLTWRKPTPHQARLCCCRPTTAAYPWCLPACCWSRKSPPLTCQCKTC